MHTAQVTYIPSVTQTAGQYRGIKISTKAEAIAESMHPLTQGYNLPGEGWMLDNVINDMNRGGIAFKLVPEYRNQEILCVYR